MGSVRGVNRRRRGLLALAVAGVAPGLGAIAGCASSDLDPIALPVPTRRWSAALEDKRQALQRLAAAHGIDVARTSDNQLKLTLPTDALFEDRGAAIRPARVPLLMALVEGLGASTLQLRVIAHADIASPPAQALALSRQRAEALGGYLARHGVAATRISTEGRGDREPVTSDSRPEARAQNRRVEVYLREPG
jgi:outer membrane protein OmpA-like peptidoglycan-associated protein